MKITAFQALNSLLSAINPGSAGELHHDSQNCLDDQDAYNAIIEFHLYLESLPSSYKNELLSKADQENTWTIEKIQKRLAHRGSLEPTVFGLSKILANEANLLFFKTYPNEENAIAIEQKANFKI